MNGNSLYVARQLFSWMKLKGARIESDGNFVSGDLMARPPEFDTKSTISSNFVQFGPVRLIESTTYRSGPIKSELSGIFMIEG